MKMSWWKVGHRSLAGAISLLLPHHALSQLPLNFQPFTGTVLPSAANVSCNATTGCSTPFLQEVISSGGASYYHIVIGDGASNFAMEYYIRTLGGTVCWFGCAGARFTGMGGMGGDGVAPLSASAGPGGLAGNGTNPLGTVANSGNGTGRPDQTVIRMVNKSADLQQEFLKATETTKPKITQVVNNGGVTSNFAIDMTNLNYSTINTPATVSLTQTVGDTGIPATQTGFPSSANFDIANFAATREVTGGRYTYTAGSGDGGSAGTYTYFADKFDLNAVDWASFCDPAQNPDSSCVFGIVGGGMGGMGGM